MTNKYFYKTQYEGDGTCALKAQVPSPCFPLLSSNLSINSSLGTNALDLTKGRTQAELGKTFIANGAATAADVQNQINLVKDDLVNAAVALTALEGYAATLSNMADGTQDFQRYLSIVRRNYNDFTSRLYGIQQKITLSDYDPDFYVLKFIPTSGGFYANFSIADFEI